MCDRVRKRSKPADQTSLLRLGFSAQHEPVAPRVVGMLEQLPRKLQLHLEANVSMVFRHAQYSSSSSSSSSSKLPGAFSADGELFPRASRQSLPKQWDEEARAEANKTGAAAATAHVCNDMKQLYSLYRACTGTDSGSAAAALINARNHLRGVSDPVLSCSWYAV